MSSMTQNDSETAPIPATLPLTTAQYEKLVELGTFEGSTGQIELINGRIVRMNPQGPEPDLAWVARRRYFDQHPNPLDVYLLIEVSFSSSQFDRAEKQILYARSGISEYWQVDVPSRTVSVHRSPKEGAYANVQILDASMTISPQCSPESVLPIKELFANE
jgi:Uma2 family endonuclease